VTRYVFLAGEGKTELGGWAGNPTYRADKPPPGVLEALLGRVAPDGWEMRGAVEWKQLTRYRANEPRLGKDELNTRALWLLALERDCDLIVFSRDRDRAVERAEAVESGRRWLDDKCAETGLRVVGGMAHECIEAWVLAVSEERRTENLTSARAKRRLAERGITDIAEMVKAIGAAELARVPADARSLLAWLGQARDVLAERNSAVRS
jgi:hypothetical protein